MTQTSQKVPFLQRRTRELAIERLIRRYPLPSVMVGVVIGAAIELGVLANAAF